MDIQSASYVLTYSTKCEDPISDENFRARKYPSHHTSKYFNVQSAFEKLGVLMVTQVPLDCMHLVELDVMRKFLQRLYNNKVV